MNLENTAATAFSADYIRLNSRVYAHGSHAGTDFSVACHFADLYSAGVSFLRKRCNQVVALFAGKASSDFVAQTAAVFIFSIPMHSALPSVRSLGTPNNSFSQHFFQEDGILLGDANKK
jgi:hypothetical protein